MVIDVFTRRMFNQAIAGQAPPVQISTDHDPLFHFHRWLANLRILEVEEIKSVPHVPMSHPFVERQSSRAPLPRRSHASEPCRESFIIDGKPGALCPGKSLQWTFRNSRRRLIGNSHPTPRDDTLLGA